MARGKETEVTNEIVKTLVEEGAWGFKIPDSPPSPTLRFSVDRPFDVACSVNGSFVGIEVKFYDRYKPFGMKELRESQVLGLSALAKGKGLALVMLVIRFQANPLIDLERTNRLLIFDYRELLKKGRYSAEELMQYPYIKGFKKRYRGIKEDIEQRLMLL